MRGSTSKNEADENSGLVFTYLLFQARPNMLLFCYDGNFMYTYIPDVMFHSSLIPQ